MGPSGLSADSQDYNYSNQGAKTAPQTREAGFRGRSDLRRRVGARLPAAHGLGAGQRFVHDTADGAGAPAALRAAAQALVNLARGTRRVFAVRQRGTHVVVGQDIAGANNHLREARQRCGVTWDRSLADALGLCKEKTLFKAILSLHCGINAYVVFGKSESGTRWSIISAFDIGQRLKVNLE